MRKLTIGAILLGSIATQSIAQTCFPPDDDWCKTPPHKIKPMPLPIPRPTFPRPPKWDDDFGHPRPWEREFPPEFPIRKPPILLRSVALIVAKQDGPARNYARLEGKTYFQGEWTVAYSIKNSHPSRSLKVKVKRMVAGPGLWPVVQSAYYTLAPGETEDLGSIGQTFKKVGTPEIEGAWYTDEVGG